jgi:hypothetical protein
VTKLFAQSQTLPLQRVSVIAGVLRDVPPTVQCIKLERPCGDITAYGRKDSVSDATIQRAEAIQKQIEDFAAKVGLEVRAGIYE